jgi:hypothetical protein
MKSTKTNWKTGKNFLVSVNRQQTLVIISLLSIFLLAGQSLKGENSNPPQVNETEADLPDLFVNNIEVLDSTGHEIKFKITIENKGGAATAGEFINEIYLSTDKTIDNSDTKILTWTFGVSLSAGASHTSNTFTRINELPDGIYYLGVIADATNTQEEEDETNNIACNEETYITIGTVTPIFEYNAQEKFSVKSYPNPFADQFNLQITLSQAEYVQADILNVQGIHLYHLMNDILDTGTTSIIWDGNDFNGNPLKSGLYIIRVQFDDKALYTRITKL